MKHLILPAIAALLISVWSFRPDLSLNTEAVNAIIGNTSFVEKFGILPDARTSEQLRISTHLEHVEQLLRARNVDHLSIELKEQRSDLLDLLHQYRMAKVFPRNYDHPDQR
ncbi:MAG: hypothetical protein M3R08_08260, partial [Bacteroidota bacterium]|nr:hypothetical protein [Bacteroidota bacterium]